jgi:dimethylamine corrinoid protein
MGKIDLVKVLAELDEDLVVEGVKEQMAAGVPAIEILAQLQTGMEQVGKLYEEGEYYLSELIMSADVFSSAAALLGDALTAGGESKTLGTMVLGTVKDDIHDIGKNIVSTILTCNGFKVVDVGVDAPISAFVEAVKTHKPQVVGMCCLLTTAFDIMKETVAAVKIADPNTKVLVGGGPVDENVRKYCGADGYCKSAYEAVELTKKHSGVN